MEVYFIRHGIAAERGTYADDEQRPLVEKGKVKTAKVAERLLATGLKFDLILSSPLVRAYQTAQILKQAGLSQGVETFTFLKPDGAIAEWLEWLNSNRLENPKTKIALVGHQPDLSQWIEMLIWGNVKNQLVVKKAGVIGLEIPDIGTPISRSTLFLLTSPKWIL